MKRGIWLKAIGRLLYRQSFGGKRITNCIRLLESAKRQKKVLDVENIERRLNSYADLNGAKVSDDMIEMFVERIICRGNDEFLWVINLSSDATGSGQKYRISGYDAKSLNDDSEFNIVTKFVIPVEECEDYCKNILHGRFVPKYWKNIIVKIAVC